MKELVYDEPTSELNPLFEQGPVHDYQFCSPATVRVRYYRAGQELFFAGKASSEVTGQCARCLDCYAFTLASQFSFVLVPRSGHWASGELDEGDIDINWYEGDEVDLSPLLRERILLALPTLPLCEEGCQGLCAQCGANLNDGRCNCVVDSGDARMAVFRELKRGC